MLLQTPGVLTLVPPIEVNMAIVLRVLLCMSAVVLSASVPLPNDFDLAKALPFTVLDNVNISFREDRRDFVSSGTNFVSPTASKGTVVATLKVPTGWDNSIHVQYQLTASPFVAYVDDKEAESGDAPQLFEIVDNQLVVALDDFVDKIDYDKYYDQPQTISIVAYGENAAGEFQTSAFNVEVRIFSQYFIYEPEWQANPPLEPEYTFSLDCPTNGARIGSIADDDFIIATDILYSIDSSTTSDAVKRHLRINATSGELSLADDDDDDTASTLRATKHDFLVVASLDGEDDSRARVNLVFGSCDGSTLVVDHPLAASTEPAAMQGSEAPRPQTISIDVQECPVQGQVLGSVPREYSDADGTMAKYQLYYLYPFGHNFSVTQDGQVRLLADGIAPGLYEDSLVTARGEKDLVQLFQLRVRIAPCPPPRPKPTASRPPTLPPLDDPFSGPLTPQDWPSIRLARHPMSDFPQVGSPLVDLNRSNGFANYMRRFGPPLSTPLIVTSHPEILLVDHLNRLIWRRLPQPGDIHVFIFDVSQPKRIEIGEVLVQFTRPFGSRRPSADAHYLPLRCAKPSQRLGQISPAHLPLDEGNHVEYHVDGSPYFGIDRRSGVLFVAHPLPQEAYTHYLTVRAVFTPVFVSIWQQPVSGAQRVATARLRVDTSCDGSGDLDECVEDGFTECLVDAQQLECEYYDFLVDELPIGVVTLRGDDDAESDAVVGRVYANHRGKRPFVWSISDDSFGYKIDATTGVITTVGGNTSLSISADATDDKGLTCHVTLRPSRYRPAAMVAARLETVNTAPPRFEQEEFHLRSRINCAQPADGGEDKFGVVRAGTVLGKIAAVDPDSGRGAERYFTLCNADTDDRLCTQRREEFLEIDESSGIVAAARDILLSEDPNRGENIEMYQVKVRVSNEPAQYSDDESRPSVVGVGLEHGDLARLLITLECASNS